MARGRELFGGIVDWDAVWTPGANRATWIDFSAPVTFEGHAVAAGRYALWVSPHENGEWDVTLVDVPLGNGDATATDRGRKVASPGRGPIQ